MSFSNKIKFLLLALCVAPAYTLPKSKKKQNEPAKTTRAQTTTSPDKKNSNTTPDNKQADTVKTTQSSSADKQKSVVSTQKFANQSVDTEQSDSSSDDIDWDAFVAKIQISFISDTRNKLSNLLILINNNQVKSLKNKQEIQFYFNYLIKELEKLQINKFNGENPQHVAVYLLRVNEAIMDHISQSLAKGLQTLSLIPLPELITKAHQRNNVTRQPFSRPALHNLLEKNGALSKQVSQQTDTLGLEWYNYAYRMIDDTFIDPLITYDVVPTTAMIAIAGASIYCLHKDPNKAMAITSFIGWNGDRISKKWYGSIEPYLTKKIAVARNRLKGGIYNTIADQLDGIDKITLFKDLIGADYEIEQFRPIINYIANPELYSQMGIMPHKGYILVGPPGTGKTWLVKTALNEAALVCKTEKLNHFVIKSAEIYKYGGLDKVFERARNAAPCILFFDEFDLLNLQRGVGNTSMLDAFLTNIDGIFSDKDPNKQIIIIAATNRPETIDSALLRPGRLDKQIRFKLPSFDVRKQTIASKLKKVGLSFQNADTTEKIITKIALETEGASYEALNILICDAFMQSRSLGEVFNEKHLEYALNESFRKIKIYHNEQIPAHEQNRMATHFAGQALTLTLLNSFTKLAHVTILPHMPHLKEESLLKLTFGDKEIRNKEQDRYTYGAVFTYTEGDTIGVISKDELINQCKMHVAGIVAEESMLGSASFICNREAMNHAMHIAKTISFEGMKEDSLPKEEQLRRFKHAEQIIENCKKEVRALLATHKDKLTVLINELQEKKQLNQAEVAALVQQSPDCGLKIAAAA